MSETKKYRVSGTQEVLGHQPDEEFDAVLDSDQEALLIQSGALEEVKSSGKSSAAKSPPEEPAGDETPPREE